jgi:hypothetical protein
LTSQTTFAVEAGVEYEIAVDGFAGAVGSVVLEWAFEATPDVLPQITLQPQSQMVASGSGATLGVQTAGENLRYQWYQNGALIAGAKNSTLVLTNVGLAQVGGYAVQVINATGTQTNESQVAFIEVYQVVEGQMSGVGLGQEKLQDLTLSVTVLKAAKIADMPAQRLVMPRWQVVRPLDLPPVSGYTVSRCGDTRFDTTQLFENAGDPVISGHSRWQALVVPYAGICTLSTAGSEFDTVLEVVRMDGANLVRVAYDDNSGADGKTSWLQFEADPVEEYYVRVAGVGDARGQYQLTEVFEVPQRYRQWEHIAGEGYVFTLQVPKAMVFRVDGSTDLKNWEGILSTNSATGLYEFRHSDDQRYDHRFYRAVLFP